MPMSRWNAWICAGMLAGVSASNRRMIVGSTVGSSLRRKGTSAATNTTRRMLVSFQAWRAMGRGWDAGWRDFDFACGGAMEGKKLGSSRANPVHDQSK